MVLAVGWQGRENPLTAVVRSGRSCEVAAEART
jgi:hypothetical protein